jgi:hypothetical protein
VRGTADFDLDQMREVFSKIQIKVD